MTNIIHETYEMSCSPAKGECLVCDKECEEQRYYASNLVDGFFYICSDECYKKLSGRDWIGLPTRKEKIAAAKKKQYE